MKPVPAAALKKGRTEAMASRTGHSEAPAVVRRTVVVLIGFGVYAFAAVLAPAGESVTAATVVTLPEARQAWLAAGCQACHSVYGLGGHVGPDLTNILSRTSAEHVRAVVRAGQPGMPPHRDLDAATLELLIRYLEAVDRSGRYPPESLASDGLGGS